MITRDIFMFRLNVTTQVDLVYQSYKINNIFNYSSLRLLSVHTTDLPPLAQMFTGEENTALFQNTSIMERPTVTQELYSSKAATFLPSINVGYSHCEGSFGQINRILLYRWENTT